MCKKREFWTESNILHQFNVFSCVEGILNVGN